MAWYTWSSQTDFETWHTTVCQGLGIPHPNHNGATGEVDPDATWTLRYTDVHEISPDDWRAVVDDDVAGVYQSGLGQPSSEPSSQLTYGE